MFFHIPVFPCADRKGNNNAVVFPFNPEIYNPNFKTFPHCLQFQVLCCLQSNLQMLSEWLFSTEHIISFRFKNDPSPPVGSQEKIAGDPRS